MQTAFTSKLVVPQRKGAAAKPTISSRHIANAIRGPEREEASTSIQGAIVASLAAIFVSAEGASALAAPPPPTSQGAALEQFLAQQGAAKTVKAAGKPAEVAVYAKSKASAPTKLAATAATSKPASKAKPSTSKATAVKSASTKPLKFDSKASSGTQGAAPAGLELPLPKGATSNKPVVSKPAAPKPKPAAIKKEAVKTSAASPAIAKKETFKPVIKPAAPAVKTAAAASAVAATKAAAISKTPRAPPAPKVSAKTSNAPGLSSPAVQAGAVLAAELAGLAVASAIVGGITRPSKA